MVYSEEDFEKRRKINRVSFYDTFVRGLPRWKQIYKINGDTLMGMAAKTDIEVCLTCGNAPSYYPMGNFFRFYEKYTMYFKVKMFLKKVFVLKTFYNLYQEVSYRPGNSGYLKAKESFTSLKFP